MAWLRARPNLVAFAAGWLMLVGGLAWAHPAAGLAVGGAVLIAVSLYGSRRHDVSD